MSAGRRVKLSVKVHNLAFSVLRWGIEGGRPVVLLHGFPQEPETWTLIAEALAENGYDVFAPAQRGYVSEARPSDIEAYAFQHFVDDAMGIADGLGIGRFDVVGFGLGGAQAWMLAANLPSRVRSLTSIRFPHPAAFAQGVLGDPQQQEKWRALQAAFGSASLEERTTAMLANDAAELRRFLSASGLPQPYLNRYVERLKQPQALIAAFRWEHAIQLDQFARVPPVTVPTLLFWNEGPALARTTIATTKDFVCASYDEIQIQKAGNFLLETGAESLIPPLLRHLRSH